jgi:broad specificity phosphatase PhoE
VPPRPSAIAFYYIRHGQTDWNAQWRFQGRREIPLNATGKEQARANGARLKAHLGDRAADLQFIASPMQRARQTMEIILEELGLPSDAYITDKRLVEAAYGEWEGLTLDDVKREETAAFEAREANRWHFAPPGGESLAMAMERIMPLIHALDRETVIVAHGAVGRTVRKAVLGLDEDEAGHYVFPQDRIFRFEGATESLI